jgi:hypothetical protein
MYPSIRAELADQRIADLHRQAARQRLLRDLHANRKPAVRPRQPWVWWRWPLRRPRPALNPSSGGR